MKFSKFKLSLSLFLLLPTLSFGQGTNGCAPKVVLMEMACGRNCAPCFEGIQSKKSLYADHEQEMAFVYYAQAPIGLGLYGQTNLPYNGFHDVFNIDYQSSVMIDRTFFPNNLHPQEGNDTEVVDNEEMAFNEQIASTYVPVSIDINHTYNSSTKELSINLTGNFCEAASGDLRFYLVLTQDSVMGPGNDEYAQASLSASSASSHGYYDYTTGPFGGSGGTWINGYDHPHVVAYQPSGFFGNSGVIPSSVSAGQSFSENYSFTLPDFPSPTSDIPLDPNRVQIIAAVVKAGSFQERQVLNANKIYLNAPVSELPEIDHANVSFDIVGNPINSSSLTLSYESKFNVQGSVYLFSASGELIRTLENEIELNSTIKEVTYDIGNLSSGIYFVGLKTDTIQYTRKLLVK